MYLGQIVELAEEDDLFSDPLHPYTHALISAVPEPDPVFDSKHVPLQGEIPSPVNPPSGCYFHTRCPVAQDRCRVEMPEISQISTGRQVRCHYPGTASEDST
jgi:oligopeptide/dipeptide ABC transporter ATP-binding protein